MSLKSIDKLSYFPLSRPACRLSNLVRGRYSFQKR
jgi:hypothetical protein